MKVSHYHCLIVLLVSLCSQVHAAEIRVAAASNLRYVLPELAKQFEYDTGHQVALTYAASGTLTTQIKHGAPFDVFMAAHTDYIERLIKSKLTQGNALTYAQAQLVLFLPHHSKLAVEDGIQSLKVALDQNQLRKVAIANPRHAPYGQAAMRELQAIGVWQQIQPYLLFAENASQVAQFSLSTSVDAGFIPYSHIIQPALSSKGQYILLETRLPQQAVVVRGASEYAEQFLTFLQTELAGDSLIKHGFILPADE